LLAHGRWFSPASSTNKTDRHDIAEILHKVVLKHQKSNQIYSVLKKLYTKPSIGAFYQISGHLATLFQRRRLFLEIDQSETRIACGGHVC